MNLKHLAVTAVLAVLAIPAFAADLPPGPPEAPPFVPEVPSYNWTGLHAGIHAGFGWGESDGRVSYFNKDNKCCSRENSDFDDVIDADGFLAGGQVGYDYQSGNFVIGAEADLSWADINGERDIFDDGDAFGTASFNIDWLATVRGRFGVTYDRFLIYATGGVAFAGVESTLDYAGDPKDLNEFNGPGTDSSTRVGWTVGAGLEGFVTENITARIEYLYVDLGGEDNVFFDNDCFDINGESEISAHIVRAALNFKW